jgi:hypothetical protein
MGAIVYKMRKTSTNCKNPFFGLPKKEKLLLRKALSARFAVAPMTAKGGGRQTAAKDPPFSGAEPGVGKGCPLNQGVGGRRHSYTSESIAAVT